MTFFLQHQGGQLTDAFYRAVATFPGSSVPSHIFGAIQVRVDPDGPDTADAVYFGITQGTGGVGAYLLVIPPEPSTTPPVSGSVPHDPVFPRPNTPANIGLYKRAQSIPPCPGPAVPCWVGQTAVGLPWLRNTATWLGSPGVSWAITFEIDTAQIGIGNGAQVYFGAGISEPADGGTGQTIVSLTSGSQTPGTGIGSTVVPQDPSTWPQLPPQVGQACASGLGIYTNTIGVLVDGGFTTADGGTNPINTSPGAANTFRVEIHNVPASLAETPFSLRARLRVSDWATALGDPAAVWDSCGVGTEVFTMDSSAFTSPPWAWSSQPDAGIVDIDYTCTVDGGAYCPQPSNGATQSRQIVLADIGLAQTAGIATVQYAQAYRDVYYSPPLSVDAGSGIVTAIPILRPPCGCYVVGGEGWSVAALGATGLGAGLLAVRGLRRRRRSSTGR